MSDKEKRIVEKVKKALPTMSDFEKGYILGRVEHAAEKNCEREREREKEQSKGE